MSEDSMAFPNTWDEFEKIYGFTDTEEIYTNGSRLIQSFRVEQWLEHLQAVPVIRCKDCKWNREKEWVDCYMSGMHGRNVNNFCSQGKRREE